MERADTLVHQNTIVEATGQELTNSQTPTPEGYCVCINTPYFPPLRINVLALCLFKASSLHVP